VTKLQFIHTKTELVHIGQSHLVNMIGE